MILVRLIDLYSLVVVGAIVLSWLRLPPDHPAQRIADTLVEPVLRPIRNVLPPAGGLDFSPMILLVGLHLLARLLR